MARRPSFGPAFSSRWGLLIVYRIGTYIPVPGIDGAELRAFMDQAASGLGGILNMFTGGAISRMGILALGIMPLYLGLDHHSADDRHGAAA